MTNGLHDKRAGQNRTIQRVFIVVEIYGECACVATFTLEYSGKIKENMNRAGYRCHLLLFGGVLS